MQQVQERPSTVRRCFGDLSERVLWVASGHLGTEARFVGPKDWIMALFCDRFPGQAPGAVGKALLSNFVQQVAYHGVRDGRIVPERVAVPAGRAPSGG
jgi:hypothetical protein